MGVNNRNDSTAKQIETLVSSSHFTSGLLSVSITGPWETGDKAR